MKACEMCDEVLCDEELRGPATASGYTMCDQCFEADWSHTCGLCGELEADDIPTFAMMVGNRAEEAELVPGVYQVLRWPWLSDCMLSQHVSSRSVLRVGDAPERLEDGEVLCRECALKAIVRRTGSGRWRVTTVRWRWGWWRSKTRVYRTRALATRRARAYLYADAPA